MDIFQVVSDWHEKMGVYIPDRPTFFGYPDQLMVDLIQEEFDELMEAIADKNMVETADALGDLIWVACGAARRLGVDIRPVIAEIARSNFTKNGDTSSTGKIQKGPNYSPPDLKHVLEAQGWEGE